MSGLPAEALAATSRIEAMLDEAERLLAQTQGLDDAGYALAETRRRYLPDTLSAFLDIPPSTRDAAAEEMLLGQLTLLERATASRLQALAEAGRSALAVNGAFLSERFGPVESLPDVPAAMQTAVPASAPPQTIVARFFSDIQSAGSGGAPAQLLEVAAAKLSRAFPRLTTVKRGLFGGPPKAVSIDVPSGDHALRYTLEAERFGIAASCTKIVRGIALRTERVDVGEWLQGLMEDVGAYVERDRAAREFLTTAIRG
jgi:hypothetical protein